MIKGNKDARAGIRRQLEEEEEWGGMGGGRCGGREEEEGEEETREERRLDLSSNWLAILNHVWIKFVSVIGMVALLLFSCGDFSVNEWISFCVGFIA